MSNCYCDYDLPEVWRSSVVKARKEYRCEECAYRIKPGEKYEYVWGIWEGCQGSFRTCAHCLELRRWVKNSLPCFCWAHGNLLDDCRNAIEDAYDRARDEVRGLRFGYLRLRVKHKRLMLLA